MSHGTQVLRLRVHTHFVYGTFTPSGRPSQQRSTIHAVLLKLCGPSCNSPTTKPYNTGTTTVQALHNTGLGSSLFVRHYSENLFLDFYSSRYLDGSVPWVSPLHPMYSDADDRYPNQSGYPIRLPPALGMFAPPRGFSQLTTAFLAK